MTRRVRFRPEAEADVDEVLRWYQDQGEPETRGRFLIAIRQTTDRLADHPELGPIVQGDARRVMIEGFPYSIMYRLRDDVVVVVGCFHFRLDPKRWHNRLQVEERSTL